MSTVSGDVARLLADARAVYRDDPVASAALESLTRRWTEPLRIGIVGMVKAGKSTLLNAIIGEEVAATDAGECTKIVTWYRYGDTRRITLYPIEGAPRTVPVRRHDGGLVFDLGGLRADDVDRLVVEWPAKSLLSMTLIDTPGTASVSEGVSERTNNLLRPHDAPLELDAIVYLARHLHAEDLQFLEAFRDASNGFAGSVNAVAVLSRADEIGGGRIDALLSASRIADRYRRDGAFEGLALDVLPVAGLLAQTARTLRQVEFSALAELAALDTPARNALLVSAARFTKQSSLVASSPEVRAQLLERLGLFGVRFSAALIRGGITEANQLSHDLARRSGLHELVELVEGQFHARADFVKSQAALTGVEALVKGHPRAGSSDLSRTIERIRAGAHEFRELRSLATIRGVQPRLPAGYRDEATRLIGGHGVELHERLGLPAGTPPTDLRVEAAGALDRWREVHRDPLVDAATAELSAVVVRSCEAMVLELSRPAGLEVLDLALLEPAFAAGEETRAQAEYGQRRP